MVLGRFSMANPCPVFGRVADRSLIASQQSWAGLRPHRRLGGMVPLVGMLVS